MSSGDLEILQSISNKLSVLISLQLTGLQEAPRTGGSAKIVGYLASFGLDAKEISAVTGSSVQSVRTMLTPKRRIK